MSKYIKVTEKDKRPIVVLSANKAFFMRLNAKIEEPTKKEIEAFFPEERSDFPGKATLPHAESKAVKEELEAVKAIYAETKQTLIEVQAELEATKAELDEVQKKQITNISKKE
jgi:predicted PhzF superfamily epimerase YddE/YHI9